MILQSESESAIFIAGNYKQFETTFASRKRLYKMHGYNIFELNLTNDYQINIFFMI